MATLRVGIDARGAMAGAATFAAATNTIKGAATSTMATLTKLAALAGASLSMGFVLKNALQAEDIANKLAASLRLVGAATQSNIKSFSQYAAEMQRKTIYDDESIMAQMTTLKNMGVHTTRLKEATTAAIGLAGAYKMDLASAVTLVGKAWYGETGMLARRGIIIDQVGSAQQKFNRLLEVGINGISLAEAEAQTAAGSLAQMRNAIGDAAETLGMAFLPMIKASAIATKEWMEGHQPELEKWSGQTANAVQHVGEMLKTFISLMKEDLPTATSFGLDLATDAFVAWGKDISAVVEKIFTDMVYNIPIYIQRMGAAMGTRSELNKTIYNQVSTELYPQQGIKKLLPGVTWGGSGGVTREQQAQMEKAIQMETNKRLDAAIQELYSSSQIATEFPTKELRTWESISDQVEANHRVMVDNMKRHAGTLPDVWRDKFTAIMDDWDKTNTDILNKYNASKVAMTAGASGESPSVTAGTNERVDMSDMEAKLKISNMNRSLQDEYKLIGLSAEARARKVEVMKMERIYTDELGYSLEQAAEASKDFDKQMEELQQLQKLNKLADDIGMSFGTAFEDMAVGAKSASEAMQDLLMDVSRLVFRMMVTIPIAEALSSALMSAGFGVTGGRTAPDAMPAGGTNGVYAALGMAIDRGKVMAYANGTVVDRPTLFPMANGAGLMGEAGPEAIMPLRRSGDGRLGVSSNSPNTIVQNQIIIENKSSQPVKATAEKSTFDGKKYVTNIVLEDINTNGPIARGLNSRQ